MIGQLGLRVKLIAYPVVSVKKVSAYKLSVCSKQNFFLPKNMVAFSCASSKESPGQLCCMQSAGMSLIWTHAQPPVLVSLDLFTAILHSEAAFWRRLTHA